MHWCVKSKFSLSRQQNIFPPRNPLPRPSLLPAHPRLVLSAHVVITGRECSCPYHYPHSWCLYIFYYVCMLECVCVSLQVYWSTAVGMYERVLFSDIIIFSVFCIPVSDVYLWKIKLTEEIFHSQGVHAAPGRSWRRSFVTRLTV